ncbi:MAG: hypothetical protein ACE5G0_10140 [Rhodothermales bacterium]
MDPITAAVTDFQAGFRAFRDNEEARVLRVIAGPEQAGMLTRLLRAEEWQPENRSPFLVFDTAYMQSNDAFASMSRVVREHYVLLQEAFEKEGRPLPDMGPVSGVPQDPENELVANIEAFTEGVCTELSTPLICWLPANMEDPDQWRRAVVRLFGLLWNKGFRFVVADDENEHLTQTLEEIKKEVDVVRFEIDEKEAQDYFKKLLGPASPGRAPGTPSGSAAPDVAPPPRPGPNRPAEEHLRMAAEEAGLPPMLTMEQAEQLRQLVFEAATALGETNEYRALEKQQAACSLCAEAGVTLEEAVMTLLLANYLLQFGREREAEAQYHRAEELAGEAKALPQVAQARMALGYLLLKNKRLDEAAHIYEQAAAAAVVSQSHLLYFESLRMAGTCHLQAGRPYEAMLCWQGAVEKSRDVSPDEVRLSNFLDIAANLIELLRKNGLTEQARSVEALILEVGEQFAV